MATEKIEPRLAREIDAAQAAGASRLIPVVIEHRQAATPAGDGDPRTRMEAMAVRARESQRGIVERLAELGASSGIERAVLANALSVPLTPEQIRAIASHPDVKLIRLGIEQQVTA
jgi:hypothetical protein